MRKSHCNTSSPTEVKDTVPFSALHMDILTLPLRCYDRAMPLAVPVQCLQMESFSPRTRKGFTFSSHSHGKWQLGPTGVSGHKNWTDLLCSWNEYTRARGSCSQFLNSKLKGEPGELQPPHCASLGQQRKKR